MKRLLVVMLLLSSLAGATNLTVGSGKTYATIQACATAMANGDTCTVYAGTYAENVTVPAGVLGGVKTITVNGDDVVNVLSLTLNSYNTVIGGTILRPTTTGLHIQTTAGTACITINNPTTNVNISNSNLYACGLNGMLTVVNPGGVTTGASYVKVQNNTLAWSCGTSSDPNICHGIYAFGDHWLIEGNDISHVNLGVQREGTYGVVRNNIFHDVWGRDPLNAFPSNRDCIPGLSATGTISGTTVTYSTGDHFSNEFPGAWVTVNGSRFYINTVPSSTSMTLIGSPPTGSVTLAGGFGQNCHTDFFFAESALPNQYNLVENNTIYNSPGSDNHGYLAQGDACGAGNCKNLIIRFNVAAHIGGGGVADDCAGSDTVNPCFAYVKVYNNTWVDAAAYSSANLFGGNNSFSHNSTNPSQINDIFYYPTALATDWNPYYDNATTDSTFTYKNNLAWCVGIALGATGCVLHNHVYGSGTFTSDAGNIFADPLFASYSSSALGDLHLLAGSLALAGGSYLTTANGASNGTGLTSSTSLTVADAAFFQDGLGLTAAGVQPDWICVGTVSNCSQVTVVNYATNVITLLTALTWSNAASVWTKKDSSGNNLLTGAAPNMGALGSGTAPAVTLSASSHNFGVQNVGVTSGAFTFTVTNSGTATLTFSATPLIGGTNATDFAITSNTCGTTGSTLTAGARP